MRRVARAPKVRVGVQNAVFDISRSHSSKPAHVQARYRYVL